MNLLTSIFSSSTAQIILAVLSLAAGLGAYIVRLRSEVEKHQNTIAQLQQQAQSQEFQQQISEVVKRVKESTIDFNTASDQFIKQYGDGSKPDTSTGASSDSKPNSKLPPKQ